jgi:hypothetical protein
MPTIRVSELSAQHPRSHRIAPMFEIGRTSLALEPVLSIEVERRITSTHRLAGISGVRSRAQISAVGTALGAARFNLLNSAKSDLTPGGAGQWINSRSS